MANIIFLNGTSSSGKTSIAKSIQALADDRYFHLSVDTFCHMMDMKFFEGDFFMDSVNVAVSAMNRMAQYLYSSGQNVIIDTVIEDPFIEWIKECLSLFDGYNVTLVNVICDIKELEERERKRGDRKIGQAAYQLQNMSIISDYDLRVNTSKLSSEDCARYILNNLIVDWNHGVFRILKEKFEDHIKP